MTNSSAHHRRRDRIGPASLPFPDPSYFCEAAKVAISRIKTEAAFGHFQSWSDVRFH